MIWATVSSQSCFCWWYRASWSLAAKNIISLILVLTIWWCPCVQSSPVFLEADACYDQFIFLAKSPLAFDLLCFVLQGQICLLLQVSRFPTFVFHSPIMKMTSILGVSSRSSSRSSSCRTVHLQFHQHYWSGHRLGLLWYWMVCLGNEQRSFRCFWDCNQVLHFVLFC